MSGTSSVSEFQKLVKGHYRQYGRDLPWRRPALRVQKDGTLDPYLILVSEIMLQQTQVSRVVPKFAEFISAFPTIAQLAEAPLGKVLQIWNGLGYNRRAKYLHQTARMVVTDYSGQLPKSIEALVKLPGVGKNTAGAIMAYAYNRPEVFIETNIRTVYIHHFFAGQKDIADSLLVLPIAETLDTKNPRQWYWALMDYGTYLKTTVGNLGRHSQHYTKQSTFDGSLRQIRGAVLRNLAQKPHTAQQLQIQITDNRLSGVLADLCREQLVHQQYSVFYLGS